MARSHPRGSGGIKAFDKLISDPWQQRPKINKLEGLPGPGDETLVLLGTDPTSWGAAPAALDCVHFSDRVFEFAGTYPNALRGYWRLGDGAFGPYADSKGVSTWANAPMERVNNSVDMSDVADGSGALGDDDDGAVQFNLATGALTSDWLSAPNTWGTGASNPFQVSVASALTVAGWVKPSASASAFDGGIFSMAAYTGLNNGYTLGVNWPTRTVFYWRQGTRLNGPVLTADEWAYIVAVHDATSDRLYVNGSLVATGASIDPSPTTNISPDIGLWNHSAGTTPGIGVLYGAVDEVQVWGVALTPTEIVQLYSSGLPCTFGGHVIEDEGVPLPQRANLNFVGAGVTATDAGGETVVTIPGSSGAIQFDTDPQSGGYLLIDTVGTLPSGVGSGFGIVFRPSDGFIVYTTSSIFLEGDSGISLTAPSGNIGITAAGTGKNVTLTSDNVYFATGAGQMDFAAGGASNILLWAYTGQIKVILASTKQFTIYKSNTTTKLFEVRDDNSVHIKSGETVQADL